MDSHEELIALTSQIVLATYSVVDGKPSLLVNETLKGRHQKQVSPPYLRNLSHRNEKLEYNGSDFNGHTSALFWKAKLNRISGWSSGSCWPTFTFREGDQYLIFVDSAASGFSAERIKSLEDKWYLYTKERIRLINDQWKID